jgi:hypothetical protein
MRRNRSRLSLPFGLSHETSIPTLGVAPKKLRKLQNVVRFGNAITRAASGLLGGTSRPSIPRQISMTAPLIL